MHDHSHAPSTASLNAAYKIAAGLNLGFVLIEAALGFGTNSLALLADAAHNLMDVAGLLLAWGATLAARKPSTPVYTYGYGRTTILAALANALAIMFGSGMVFLEAMHRFSVPVAIPASYVVATALLGILVNGGTALLFRAKGHDDLNAKGAFLHMLTDAFVSLGVVLGGLLVMFTGWTWVDPTVAIGVSILVAFAAFGLLKASLHLTMDGVPSHIDLTAIQTWLSERPGVVDVHDLHIWALSTTKTALTAHLVMPEGCPEEFLAHIAHELEEDFNVHHATLQVELACAPCCATCCPMPFAEKR